MDTTSTDQLFTLEPRGKSRGVSRRILFVQTDWEMGMARVARDLKACGHEVVKIALNFSDLYYRFRGIETEVYRDKWEHFETWLEECIDSHGIDTIFVYNPLRPYNEVACRLAERKRIGVVQFDQGLLRPLHVSVIFGKEPPFEAIHSLWSDKEKREWWPDPEAPEADAPVSSGRKLFLMGWFVLLAMMFRCFFRHYRDQRRLDFSTHFLPTLVNGIRFWKRSGEAAALEPLIQGGWSKRFFLLPLQLDHDTQIVHYSSIGSMENYLERVGDSFARCADEDDFLVVKIHPLDRGYKTFEKEIARLQDRVGKDRVKFVDRVSLDLLLENAKGVVTVNSTVGLTALRHLTPVKALGQAFYDGEDLTFQGELDEFWCDPVGPSRRSVKQFINLLEMTIQGRGTLSTRCFHAAGESGILWPAAFGDTFGMGSLTGNRDFAMARREAVRLMSFPVAALGSQR